MTIRRAYYDPGRHPFPRHMDTVSSDVVVGPVGNSRNQRRQRARLTFAEQRTLAFKMGFPVPDVKLPLNLDQQRRWITTWEEQYAQR